jgi:hypothetical protein
VANPPTFDANGDPEPSTWNYNVFDIDAGDDYLVEGDTVALRGALNKGTYGLNFGLSLNANNTQASFWTIDRIYVTEASLWAKFLDNKIGVKAGNFADFDYFTPVSAWSLAAGDGLQLSAYPIQGLQIDVRVKTGGDNRVMGSWEAPIWFDGEQLSRNIDFGVKYVNPSFTAFAVFDNDFTLNRNFFPGRTNNYQTDVFAYFAYTGIPKLTATLETKFLDLFSDRKKTPDPITGDVDAVGITNVTGIQVGYQITDAFKALARISAGLDVVGIGALPAGLPLIGGDDGITLAVDVDLIYVLNDALTFSLRPIFEIPTTEEVGDFVVSVKPKVAWTIATGPYAATINFWYMLRYYGENTAAYTSNDKEALNHTIACTFGWTF